MNRPQAPEIFQTPIAQIDATGLPPRGSPGFDQALIARYALAYATKGWNAVVTVDDEYVRVVAVPERGIEPKKYVLGLLHYRNGSLAEAISELQTSLQHDASNGDAHYCPPTRSDRSTLRTCHVYGVGFKAAATAILAARAKKDVYCEKPLARTSAQCREILAAADQSSGYFMPAMCMRFWPGWSWLKSAIDEQTYGKVKAARFRRVGEPPAWGREGYFNGAASGGALLDLHIHDTDFVQYLFGRPKAVYSQGFSFYSGAIDHVVTQYTVACGASVSAAR